MLSRSESHYFWIWWLSTLKKKSAFLIFLASKPNGNTHVTFIVFDFKATAKFTLEIFNVKSTIFSFFFLPTLPPDFLLKTFFTQCYIFGRIFHIKID